MGKKLQLTGQQFGGWTVLAKGKVDSGGNSYWVCRCSCGTTKQIRGVCLVSGKSLHCIVCSHISHGDSQSRLYRIYQDMITRCYNDNRPEFKYYGGKGITVCDEWLQSYSTFKSWALANGYKENLTIERRSNVIGYTPQNCEWRTKKEQSRNRTTTKLTPDICKKIKLMRQNSTVKEICSALGVSSYVVTDYLYGRTWKEYQ